ncbi:MAG: F0F1 ATP synthase subunit epsilon [Deltaproteobacteria bacterium]|nr:F0F1 ATP synthase subunit epsilon [Deltaproteobacteria bacterium]RLB90968.1 MAG: F0F1 ATP synthase subunit epsilon [Deltaproteobacteria bacterium]
MRLKILLPTQVLVDEEVSKVIAEAQNGSFCLLPRHIDFVAALVPGLLSFESSKGREEFLAIDEGILVKCGPLVMVSTRHAVRGADLGQLKQTVEEKFRVLDDREKMARTAIAKLEANFVTRFMEVGEYGR